MPLILLFVPESIDLFQHRAIIMQKQLIVYNKMNIN